MVTRNLLSSPFLVHEYVHIATVQTVYAPFLVHITTEQVLYIHVCTIQLQLVSDQVNTVYLRHVFY